MVLRNVVPRQGTETEDQLPLRLPEVIEKCSSPTGDGNSRSCFTMFKNSLRNVVPRQGTETVSLVTFKSSMLIEKCSSPTGDGNDLSMTK